MRVFFVLDFSKNFSQIFFRQVIILKKRQTFFKTYFNLLKGYWQSEEKWKALGLLCVVIILNFAMVYLLVQINTWYNEFYNSLQNYAKDLFWGLIGKFTGLALLYIVIAVYAIYLQQLLQIRWRTWLTNHAVNSWLEKQAYYRMQLLHQNETRLDNPDQRIQEDINQFIGLTLSLFLSLLKQLTTLCAFAVVLWNLSGAFDLTIPFFGEVKIYGYMLWFSVLYSLLGSIFAHLVGKKLIALNFDQQRYEADFRFFMTRMRENSESIAFYKGEFAEKQTFRERFDFVVKNFRALMNKTKALNFYANFYGQLAIIVPMILAMPRYFSGAMTLGGLMQTVSAFGRVQDALSYFVSAYDTIAQLIAVVDRLSQFSQHLDEVKKISSDFEQKTHERDDLILANVSVKLPNGQTLLNSCSLSIPKGRRVLITGASGAGKSTFLRTLAGIWQFASGKLVHNANDKILFLPQKPYLPLGSLRQAIFYPLEEEKGKKIFSDDALKKLLEDVDLPNLKNHLDEMEDWSKILSLGEQQRIALARVLIVRPNWIFLDEATSALDAVREENFYQLLKNRLPEMGVISVGHRASLFKQHDEELHITEEKNWILKSIDKQNF